MEDVEGWMDTMQSVTDLLGSGQEEIDAYLREQLGSSPADKAKVMPGPPPLPVCP